MKGIDLVMSLDASDDWIRTGKQTARRKTDYEKQLEKSVMEYKDKNQKLINENETHSRVRKAYVFIMVCLIISKMF